MKLWRLTFVLLLVLLAGCAKAPPALESVEAAKAQAQQLSEAIMQLSGEGDRAEAELIARTAVKKSADLFVAYQVETFPRLHNLLIGMGLKERGLCYHWADDLQAELEKLEVRHYAFHAAVANRGSYYFEHSSVVLTVKDQPFGSGLVLDAWRHSGNLYWVRVGEDEYEWEAWNKDQ